MDDEIIIGVTATAKNRKKLGRKKRPSQKKRRPKNKKLRLIVRCTCILFLLAILIVFLMVSPMFNIEKIEVEGNLILSTEKIISLSEIEEGNNIFRFNKFKSCDNIKENMYVESVSIKREFPNVVKINIKERTIKYLIEYASGYAYVSSQGYIIDISDVKKEVPILQGYSTDISEIKLGNRLNTEDLNKLNLTNDVVNVAESNEILNLITKIDISNQDNYVLILESEGKKVYLGDCSDLVTRIARLKAIITETAGKAGEIFIDGNTATQNPIFRENIE